MRPQSTYIKINKHFDNGTMSDHEDSVDAYLLLTIKGGDVKTEMDGPQELIEKTLLLGKGMLNDTESFLARNPEGELTSQRDLVKTDKELRQKEESLNRREQGIMFREEGLLDREHQCDQVHKTNGALLGSIASLEKERDKLMEKIDQLEKERERLHKETQRSLADKAHLERVIKANEESLEAQGKDMAEMRLKWQALSDLAHGYTHPTPKRKGMVKLES